MFIYDGTRHNVNDLGREYPRVPLLDRSIGGRPCYDLPLLASQYASVIVETKESARVRSAQLRKLGYDVSYIGNVYKFN
jgi:hypothetical protein